MDRIVVGVDGSGASRRALRWAVGEARVHHAKVDVVRVYERTPPWAAYAPSDFPSSVHFEAMQGDIEEGARRAAAHAQDEVDELIAGLDVAGVEVVAEVVAGPRTAEVLVQRSEGADLLVVGSRGRGGFKGLLLGSVSQQCATHASCPVVIIRAAD